MLLVFARDEAGAKAVIKRMVQDIVWMYTNINTSIDEAVTKEV